MSLSREEKAQFEARRQSVSEALLDLLCSPSVEPHRYHYAVLQLIPGASLDEVLARLPRPDNLDSQREALIAIILTAAQRLVEMG